MKKIRNYAWNTRCIEYIPTKNGAGIFSALVKVLKTIVGRYHSHASIRGYSYRK